MIILQNIGKNFAGTPVFDGLTFRIMDGDRIGLTGRNGAGKSTLLKMLAGQYKPDTGDIVMPKGTTIGYLPQELKSESKESVRDEALTAFAEIDKLEKEIEHLQKELDSRTDYESKEYLAKLDHFNHLHDRFHHLDGSRREEQVERILKGLGFEQTDLDRPVSEFSGGWQMRIELSKLLLREPELLLLDEPTNHLDIESITWLEEFLKDYPGAIMLVSHDVTFLDNLTNRTIEIILGKAEDYASNYTKFLEQREERRSALENAKKNQDRNVAQMEKNIEKFRAKKNKAKFAQTLIRKLDKMEMIELDDIDTSALKIRFPDTKPSGKDVAEIKGLSKSFGSKQVLKDIDLFIRRGERIAFVGKNGMGKTTLSRIITGDLKETSGLMRIGHNVQIGYFAQHQADLLGGEETIFDAIDNAATGDLRANVRSLLGTFLFSGEDVYKKIKVLSGGEKARLAMCRLLLDPINFLILDEPTNHLDVKSKEVLKKALKDFKGTLLVVSHDRDFLKGLCERVLEFRPDGVKEHLGGVDEFLREHEAKSFRDWEGKKKPAPEQTVQIQENKPSENKLSHEQRKALKKLKNKVSKVETQISDLERQIEKIEADLKDPETFQKVSADTNYFDKYEKLKSELELRMKEWEDAAADLDASGFQE